MSKTPRLRFKEFSGEWEQSKLGNEFQLSSGSTPSKANKEYFNGNNYWVTSGELKKKYIQSTIDKISDNALKECNLKKFQSGTFVIAIYGLEARGTRGSCSILKSEATISQACMAFKPKGKVYNEFLYYWYIKHGEKIGIKYAQGTKQQNLNSDLIGDLKITVPCKQEQEKIVNLFSLIDKKIEKQQEKVEALKDYKKGMMQKIFSQEIRFNGKNGEKYPEWEELNLGEICEIKTGKLDANAMVDNGQYRFYTCAKEYCHIDNYYFDTEALLISGNGANVGYIHYYNGKFNAYQRTYVLDKFSEHILYIRFYLEQYLKRRILEGKNDGNTPYIVLSTLSDMPIAIPNIEEQIKIANVFVIIDKKLEKEQEKLNSLNQWKKGLLQQMFV